MSALHEATQQALEALQRVQPETLRLLPTSDGHRELRVLNSALVQPEILRQLPDVDAQQVLRLLKLFYAELSRLSCTDDKITAAKVKSRAAIRVLEEANE